MNGIGVLIWLTSLVAWVTDRLAAPVPVGALHPAPVTPVPAPRSAAGAPELLRALNRIARECLDEGNAAAARPLLEEGLAAGRNIPGAGELVVAGTAFNLGLVLASQAEWHLARERFLEALSIEEHRLGLRDPELAATLIELAGAEEKLGDPERARSRLVRALAILEESEGPDAEALAPVLGLLARQHVLCGEPQLGQPLLVRLLAIRTRMLGEGHPELVVTLNNLAYMAEAAGNLVEARRWRERALTVGEAAWGPMHPKLAPTLDAMGSVLWSGAAWGPCRTINERLLAIRSAELGPEHPAVAAKLQDLAVLASRVGDHAESARLFARAIGILERFPHSQRPVVQKIAFNLSGLLAAVPGEHADTLQSLLERARALDLRMLAAPPAPEA